jgi:hypothetical protein
MGGELFASSRHAPLEHKGGSAPCCGIICGVFFKEKGPKRRLAPIGNNTVMRLLKITLSLAVLVLIISAAWQIGSWEVANMNLQEEIRDMASQAGTHLGIVVPKSDDDVREEVVRKAKDHGIDLQPDQVTVRRINPGEKSILHVTADYTVPVNLAFFSFNLHFTPSSEKR